MVAEIERPSFQNLWIRPCMQIKSSAIYTERNTESVSKHISSNSCNEQVFNDTAPFCNDILGKK